MKKTIIFILAILFCLSAKAQFLYIETDGVIILESGSVEQYDTPNIYCNAKYETLANYWTVTVQLIAPAATNYVRETNLVFTKTDIDSYTGSGTTETDKVQNCVLQAVAAYLLVLNPTITFTLH